MFNASDKAGVDYLGAVATFLAERYSGKDTVTKLSEVREAMKKIRPDAVYKHGTPERFAKNTVFSNALLGTPVLKK